MIAAANKRKQSDILLLLFHVHLLHVLPTLLSIPADEERDCSGPEESSASCQARETQIQRLQEHSEEPTRQTENWPQNSGES